MNFSSADPQPTPDSSFATTAEGEAERGLASVAAAGALAALVGAALWATATAFTGWRLGFLAVGVGLLVGWAVRRSGRGHRGRAGTVGEALLSAALAVAGCLLGELFATCAVIASAHARSLRYVLDELRTEPAVQEVVINSFADPVLVVCCAVAVQQAFRIVRLGGAARPRS